MRRTVTEPPDPRKRGGKKGAPRNPVRGTLPLTIPGMTGNEDIRRTGFGTHHIDEVWNTVDLSAEVPRLIARFGIEQDEDQIGSRWGGACEGQKARTYTGTTAQKDSRSRRSAGPPSDALRALLAEEGAARGVCDSFAQDYICFGFEPPRQCAALREAMERRGLVVYPESYPETEGSAAR